MFYLEQYRSDVNTTQAKNKNDALEPILFSKLFLLGIYRISKNSAIYFPTTRSVLFSNYRV